MEIYKNDRRTKHFFFRKRVVTGKIERVFLKREAQVERRKKIHVSKYSKLSKMLSPHILLKREFFFFFFISFQFLKGKRYNNNKKEKSQKKNRKKEDKIKKRR